MTNCKYKSTNKCKEKADSGDFCEQHRLANSGTSGELIEFHLNKHEEAGTLNKMLSDRFERSLLWINSGKQSKYESLVELRSRAMSENRDGYTDAIAKNGSW